MATTILGEYVLLFQMACVIFLFAYLFAKSRFFTAFLEHRATVVVQIFSALVFGFLSIYGMSSGISFYTATVNIRDFGPLAAGLACGPFVGLGAGIIGFLYRLSLGGTNVYAVALGPLLAGIIGGLVYYYSNRELVSIRTAVLVTFVTESLISAIAIVVRIVGGDSIEKVMTVTIDVALPMIIMTTISIGVFCYILRNEIRERNLQDEKLQLELEVESRRNLSTIINTIAYPVYVLDRDHRFILVNDSVCSFLGKPREEILGHTHRDFFSGADAENHWAWTEDVLSSTTPASWEKEVTIRRPDGQVCTIISTASVYRDSAGHTYLVGVIQDITERTKMQAALAENVAWYRILFEHTGAATIIINEDGTIDQANSEFSRLIGYPLNEIQGMMNWTFISHPDDLAMVKQYHRERRIDPASVPTAYTVRIIDRSGITKTLHAVVAMIPGTKKSIASYVDISEQMRTGDALQQMNRKLNLLSSITRHDIINQLMILKGFLTLLRQKTRDPSLLAYIDRSDKATANIEHQIIFTRDYQDMGVKAPAWQDIRRTFISAKGALNVQGIMIDMHLQEREVFADPLFEKVFFNLIDNSLRYGGTGMHSIRISTEDREDGLIIIYEDDGCGIADGDRQHLFERGFGKHTGLGLFLSREILSITGITIEENGSQGKGARFTIRVPKGVYRPAGNNAAQG